MKIPNPYDNGSKAPPQRLLYWLRELDNINEEMVRLSTRFVATYRKGQKELEGWMKVDHQAQTNITASPRFINLWGNAIRDVYGCGADTIVKRVAKKAEKKR